MNKQTGKSTKICRKMQIYIWQDKFRESLWLTQINGKISFFSVFWLVRILRFQIIAHRWVEVNESPPSLPSRTGSQVTNANTARMHGASVEGKKKSRKHFFFIFTFYKQMKIHRTDRQASRERKVNEFWCTFFVCKISPTLVVGCNNKVAKSQIKKELKNVFDPKEI